MGAGATSRSWARRERLDAGLVQALALAGGVSRLAKALDIAHVCVSRWDRVPRERIFAVAVLTGLEPEDIRPDETQWIAAERLRLARGVASITQLAGQLGGRWGEAVVDVSLADLWVAMAAIRFVAAEKKISSARVSRGGSREDEQARALAMGLALVAGRGRATNIAGVLGVSRQNVDNAAERFIRARDGDDPEDFIGGAVVKGQPAVLEAGRLRAAKPADPDLWALQRRYEDFLACETGLTPTKKRA